MTKEFHNKILNNMPVMHTHLAHNCFINFLNILNIILFAFYIDFLDG